MIGPIIPPTPPQPPQGPKGPKRVGRETRQPGRKPQPGQLREPGLNARGIAVRLAALATEAKRKELSMARIIERAIEETGITNPQAAMEEVNKKLQVEIEGILAQIKADKELMEEAEAWEALGDLLESNLSEEQMKAFISLVEGQIKELK
ncbi:hypothetical protein ACFLZ2_06170 [Candidatus Margulisiibacteriota bacterium]